LPPIDISYFYGKNWRQQTCQILIFQVPSWGE
jgi:hypothetical protein